MTRAQEFTIERADLAQKWAVEQCKASAIAACRGHWRQRDRRVTFGSPFGAGALDPAGVLRLPRGERKGTVVASAVPSMVHMPSRVCTGGALRMARTIASGELDPSRRVVSSLMGHHDPSLNDICHSVLGHENGPYDAVWASIVLLTYVVSHPLSKHLTRDLDECSAHIVELLETFGQREDVRRRKFAPKRKRKLEEMAAQERARLGSRAYDKYMREADDDDDDRWENAARAQREAEEEFDRRNAGELEALGSMGLHEVEAAISRGSTNGLEPPQHLAYWVSALGGPHRNVLQQCVSADPETTEFAAIETLGQQAPFHSNFVDDEFTQRIVANHARQVSDPVLRQLRVDADEVPYVTATWWMPTRAVRARADSYEVTRPESVPRTPRGEPFLCVAFRNHVLETDCACLHAVAEATTAPPVAVPLTVLWSSASWALASRNAAVPGTLEALALQTEHETHPAEAHHAVRMDRIIKQQPYQPQPAILSGLLTSWIVCKVSLDEFWADAERTQRPLVDELNALVSATLSQAREGEERVPVAAAVTAGDGLLPEQRMRSEPLLQPSPPFVIGTRASRIVERFQTDKMRREMPTRHPLLFDSKIKSTGAFISDFAPWPILAIRDYRITMDEKDASHLSGQEQGRDIGPVSASVAWQVNADRAARVVDVVRAMREARGPAFTSHALSLINVGTIQALSIEDLAESMMSERMTCAINNSRRIPQVDNSSMLFLTVYEAYVGSRTNMQAACVNTAWEGQTGAWIEPGITPPGIDAKNHGDRRCPANMCCSTGVADHLASMIAERSYVEVYPPPAPGEAIRIGPAAPPLTPQEMHWCQARFGTAGWRSAVEQIVRTRRGVYPLDWGSLPRWLKERALSTGSGLPEEFVSLLDVDAMFHLECIPTEAMCNELRDNAAATKDGVEDCKGYARALREMVLTLEADVLADLEEAREEARAEARAEDEAWGVRSANPPAHARVSSLPALMGPAALRSGAATRTFARTPKETWGVPWGLIPTVHRALATYVDALEVSRGVLSHEGAFVSEVLILPVSAYAQQLPASCRQGEGDEGYRWAVRPPRPTGGRHQLGRVHSPDWTSEDRAIYKGHRMRGQQHRQPALYGSRGAPSAVCLRGATGGACSPPRAARSVRRGGDRRAAPRDGPVHCASAVPGRSSLG